MKVSMLESYTSYCQYYESFFSVSQERVAEIWWEENHEDYTTCEQK